MKREPSGYPWLWSPTLLYLLIIKLWKYGESYRNISSNLNIPFTTISSFLARFKSWKQKKNRCSKNSPRFSRKLGCLINQNPMVMRGERQEDLHSSECNVTKQTISNEILRNGLKSRRPKKTPLLLKWHRDARLKYVWQEKEKLFWERVLWTDETKIELFGHNYRNHVWRKDGKAYSLKNLVPTVKFGGSSIMNWGCFSAKGVGKISVKWMPKSINRSYKKILCLPLRILNYLLITFSSSMMTPSIQLNLRRSGCLKIMLMFCNG